VWFVEEVGSGVVVVLEKSRLIFDCNDYEARFGRSELSVESSVLGRMRSKDRWLDDDCKKNFSAVMLQHNEGKPEQCWRWWM